MSKYINADALGIGRANRNVYENKAYADGWNLAIDIIDSAPAADVAPVVHGRWIDNGIPESTLCGCSACGFTCGAYTFSYCPNCGARMDASEKA